MTARAASLLAIESSGAGCSAALWRTDRVIAVRRQALTRGHAAVLLPLVRDTMAAAGLAWRALAAIAVTVGPGSFTGIRVGLAAARGLGLALELPVLGVSSFEVVAAGVPASARGDAGVVVLIDSGRASRFVQAFDAALVPCGPPAAVELDRLAAALPPPPALVVAAGAPPAAALAGRPVIVAAPDAAALAELAAARRAAGAGFLPPRPLYLRSPDAALPAAGGRIRA
jgi:tRNA threonylcarbamoyladenosine biosynthesis protein TsaB